MRKSFVYAAGLMCLALSITDCQKELVDQTTPASEPNFELFAQPVTTKTANNGLDTRWVAEDAINVFHAEAGSTTYVIDNQFTVKDIETGRFDGTVSKSLSADKSYDWYAFYPYSSYNKTPAGISKDTFGYTTIGGTSQTQTGNGSRVHLAGESCPLYGIASNVASDKVPSISMNHLTSVIKVSVTNNSGEDLTVSSVSFTGTEDIVGTYFINFAASPVAYKSSGNAYVSSTASLTVSNGEALANGSSADFYIALKPFTAKTGSTLKLAVNGYEKTLTLKNDITFTAGHIKPLNFNYDKVQEVWTKVSPTSEMVDGEYVMIVKSVNAKSYGYLPAIVTTSKAPAYVSQSIFDGISEDCRVSEVPASMRWHFEKNADGTWKITTADGKYLYGTNDNNGLRVGPTSGKWILMAHSKNVSAFSFKNDWNRYMGVYNDSDWRTYTSLTASNFGTNGQNSQIVLYYYGNASSLTPLDSPANFEAIASENSILVTWSAVENAGSYVLSCGAQSIETEELSYTFTGLNFSTKYVVSIYAKPMASNEYKNSPIVEVGVETEENPSGETIVESKIDFESDASMYTDWVFTNMISKQAGSINAKSGSSYGTTGGKSTASIATKNVVSSPRSIGFSISKQSGNVASSNWKVQVSTNGSTWTDVKSFSATDMNKGEWTDCSVDLSSYSNIYVRVYYSGSTAYRNIDDLTLSYVK